MSTHLKNGMTADDTGKPVFWWLNIYLREESQRAEEFGIFIVKIGYSWRQSTVTDGWCKANVSCTSYSRTFGYGILTWTTWTTLRTMARTPQSTRTCIMRSSEHAAHRLLMHSGHTPHLWLKVSPCVSFHVIHACAPVCCSLSVSPHPSFYFLVLFLFQLYLMSNSAPDEFSIEDPLCNSSLGSMVTLDYVTPLTISTPPGITPLPPTRGRTRWLVPLLILPEWHGPELSFSRFLV